VRTHLCDIFSPKLISNFSCISFSYTLNNKQKLLVLVIRPVPTVINNFFLLRVVLLLLLLYEKVLKRLEWLWHNRRLELQLRIRAYLQKSLLTLHVDIPTQKIKMWEQITIAQRLLLLHLRLFLRLRLGLHTANMLIKHLLYMLQLLP